MRPAGDIPLARVFAAVALVGGAACTSGPTATLPPIEVVVASGDGQYGTANQTLSNPLQVMVHTLTGNIPQPGTPVVWEIAAGDASIVGLATTTTDSTGTAEAQVRLGATTGEVTVRAVAQGRNNPSASFTLHTVDRPVLSDVTPTTAAPGESVTLTGQNFSPDPEENVVLFSGIRGRVTAASATQLTVTVPTCMVARPVQVSVQLGVVASATFPMTVGAGGDLLSLPVGGVMDVADQAGYTCLGLPGDGAEYLVIPFSSSRVGAAKHPFTLRGVSSAAPLVASASATRVPEGASAAETGGSVSGPVDAQSAWDRRLREEEDAIVKARSRVPTLAPPWLASEPALAPPAVGDRRSFQVYRLDGDFDQVVAVARLVSDRAALFVDEDAPAGGLTTTDLQAFADRFDDVIHPRVTGTFGSESDLDGNERVVILFSPRVNALTRRGATGFIGGFFYGIDLLPDRQGSNAAEIFYALVPDPTGIHSDARSKQTVLEVVPAILAHEFQHMVHFNERMLVREAESTEAVWLSEGMAQYAEEVVARGYEDLGDAASAELFRSGIRARARRYLGGTDSVSVIFSTGQGSLAERGASYLLVWYVEDQEGGDLLGRLTRTTRTGVTNVEAETGLSWALLLADWWSAVYLDGPGPESGPLVYPGVDLRDFLNAPFPLDAVALGAGDFTRSDSLWSSSTGYYIVVPPVGGSTTVRLSGEAGGASTPQAGLRLRVIRVK